MPSDHNRARTRVYKPLSLRVEQKAINDSHLPTLTFLDAVYTVQTQLSTRMILLTPWSANWQSPFNSQRIFESDVVKSILRRICLARSPSELVKLYFSILHEKITGGRDSTYIP